MAQHTHISPKGEQTLRNSGLKVLMYHNSAKTKTFKSIHLFVIPALGLD